jgi:hypothetical protein
VGARRRALLEWMRHQPFDVVREQGLLEGVERLVVAEHRALVEQVLDEAWTAPRSYRWIRYEDPDPVGALLRAGERLDALWREHRVGLQERVQLYGAAEEAALARLEAVAGGLGYVAG